MGDAAGDLRGVVGLAAQLLDQAAGDDPGGRHAHDDGDDQHDDHEVTCVHERVGGVLLALGALLVFQRNQLVQRFGPLLLDRTHFLDHHAGCVHGVVGQVEFRGLGDGGNRSRFMLLDLGQQGLLVLAAFGGEDLAQLGLRLVVLGGLFLELLELGLHVRRVRHQGQHAQRGQAVLHVVAHVDDHAAGDVVHAHHVIETILDLGHAQHADHGHSDQQHQHQGETQPQAHPDLHVR